MKFLNFVFLMFSMALFASCEKWSDPEPAEDPRINERSYCNDPEALNYNWDFPGKPDSLVCIYPAEVFEGTYIYQDSVYNSDNQLDSAASRKIYTLVFTAEGKKRLKVSGFCGTNDFLRFTAERTSFRAYADSTLRLTDTSLGFGQPFCRSLDTLSGTFIKSRQDSLLLQVDLKVVSDTGVYYHRGTAIKQ